MRSLKHKFTSAKADGADATLARPSNWNAEHDFGEVLTNRTGVTLAVGDVVALSTANDESVVLVDTQESLRDFVVALGTPADLATGFFGAGGTFTVKNQGAVTRGNYLRKSATTRAVEDTGTAITSKAPKGSVGFAITANAGSGTIVAYMFQHTVQADLDETQSVRNGLLNSDQEDWRDGTSVAAFGWTLVGAGASVARNGTDFATGSYSASVTRVTNDCQYERDAIAEMGGQAHIRSKTITFHARVRASVANRVRLRVNDGVGSTFSDYHSGGGTFETLKVTRTLDAAATALKCGLQVDTGDTTGQIDTCMLVFGDRFVAWQLRGDTSSFRQVFTGDGTYTKPSNLRFARVRAVAGGGAGGGVPSAGSGNKAGGGGGSGSYSESVLQASEIGATETVTVGDGGLGVSGGAGNNGEDSSFGSLVIAKGGSGGALAVLSTDVLGGPGGVAGTGNVALPGTPGGTGFASGANPIRGGEGAPSAVGGGARRLVAVPNTGEASPANTGGGGSGGFRNDSAVAGAGANGGSGIVIVWETVVL